MPAIEIAPWRCRHFRLLLRCASRKCDCRRCIMEIGVCWKQQQVCECEFSITERAQIFSCVVSLNWGVIQEFFFFWPLQSLVRASHSLSLSSSCGLCLLFFSHFSAGFSPDYGYSFPQYFHHKTDIIYIYILTHTSIHIFTSTYLWCTYAYRYSQDLISNI